jgi:DNA-binding MarR family transcriptional regulator
MKNKTIKPTNYIDNAIVEGLSTSLGQLIIQLKQLERCPRTFGEAGLLTPSEVHTIDAIGSGDGILMSELAARLAVSKGAVTQIISRLEGKEFVRRIPHPTDSRAIIVSLTKTGLLAYQAHREFDQNLYKKFSMQATPQEVEIFRTCVEKFCKILRE